MLPSATSPATSASSGALAIAWVPCPWTPSRSPARRGRDHDRLTDLRSDRLNGRIGGERDDEQRPCHLPRDRRRLGRQLISRNHDKLGVAGALLSPAQHLVPYGERTHAIADALHHTGKVGALTRREARRPALMKTPLADRDLTRVDPRRPAPPQPPPGASDRILDLAPLDHIAPAVPVESHCLHVISSVIVSSRPYLPAAGDWHPGCPTWVSRIPRISFEDGRPCLG